MSDRPVRKLQEVSERKYRLQEPISPRSVFSRALYLEFTAIDVVDFSQELSELGQGGPAKTRRFELGAEDPGGPCLGLSEEQATELYHLLGMELGFIPATEE